MSTPNPGMFDMTPDIISLLPGITAIAPTVYALLGVSIPAGLAEPALPGVLDAAQAMGGPAERCLIVAADAIGLAQIRRYPEAIAPVEQVAPHAVTLRAMSPSVTPVCYASMFSGVTPEVHGIRAYEKPVLAVDTLFDVLPREGKRVAIVAVTGSSIDRIFRQRPVAYYSEPDDAAVLAQAERLINDDQYDCLVVYLSGYDDALHRSTPWTDNAVAAMRQVIAIFRQLADAFDGPAWQPYRRAIHFAPDHGAHTNAEGRGMHGSELPEDMVVQHYFGFRAAI